jgi:putative endonuclease
MKKPYVVYILECNDGTLYTGITCELERRLRQHGLGQASKYTRSRRPVTLRYVEAGGDRSWALRREWEIKQLTKEQKRKLIHERGISDGTAKELHYGK